MTRKRTHEEYVDEVMIINPNIEVIGEYINANTKVAHRCKIDGYEWMALPSSILKCHGCPKCSGKMKKTHNEYVADVAKLNKDIEVIGTYVNNKTKILHRCGIDGYEWYAKPDNILSGKGCPRCSNKERYTQEEYVKKVSEINVDIEVIGIYVNAITPILHRCKIDGCEWYAIPNSILRGSGCPRCGGSVKKTQEEYISLVAAVNPNIEVVDTYVNNKVKILHRCKIDGCEWMAAPINILNGHGCPECRESRGEKSIAIWLDNNNVVYERQKKFEDCKDKHPLPFDFYLPVYNTVIEYNGKQHYEAIDYFGGEDAFEYIARHDKIKENYCIKNNIRLLTISYSENIYERLENLFELIMAEEVA